jgi:hypothetical protein
MTQFYNYIFNLRILAYILNFIIFFKSYGKNIIIFINL